MGRVPSIGGLRVAVTLAFCGVALATVAQPRAPQPPRSARAAAQADLTGTWVAQITEDWRWRMITPPKGDYASVPLNAAGRQVADRWDPAADVAAGEQCRVFGAGGLMRLPTRVKISWADDDTLKVATDAGEQTRLFRFDRKAPADARSVVAGPIRSRMDRRATAESVRPAPRGTDSGSFVRAPRRGRRPAGRWSAGSRWRAWRRGADAARRAQGGHYESSCGLSAQERRALQRPGRRDRVLRPAHAVRQRLSASGHRGDRSHVSDDAVRRQQSVQARARRFEVARRRRARRSRRSASFSRRCSSNEPGRILRNAPVPGTLRNLRGRQSRRAGADGFRRRLGSGRRGHLRLSGGVPRSRRRPRSRRLRGPADQRCGALQGIVVLAFMAHRAGAHVPAAPGDLRVPQPRGAFGREGIRCRHAEARGVPLLRHLRSRANGLDGRARAPARERAAYVRRFLDGPVGGQQARR